jgi:hypothetical protein
MVETHGDQPKLLLASTQTTRTLLILQKKRELIKTNQFIHLCSAFPFMFAAIYFLRAIIT